MYVCEGTVWLNYGVQGKFHQIPPYYIPYYRKNILQYGQLLWRLKSFVINLLDTPSNILAQQSSKRTQILNQLARTLKQCHFKTFLFRFTSTRKRKSWLPTFTPFVAQSMTAVSGNYLVRVYTRRSRSKDRRCNSRFSLINHHLSSADYKSLF